MIVGDSNNRPTILVLGHRKIKKLLSGFNFQSWEVLILLVSIISNICPTVLVLNLGNFKQLSNGFGLESLEIQPIAKHVRILVLRSPIKFSTVLVEIIGKFKEFPNLFSVAKFKQLPNKLCLGKFKQMPYGFGLHSWEVQTTAQLFWFRVLQKSNNCTTVLVSSLGSSNSCPTLLVLRSSKNSSLALILSFGKLKQLPTV